jgi:hypothetical protein
MSIGLCKVHVAVHIKVEETTAVGYPQLKNHTRNRRGSHPANSKKSAHPARGWKLGWYCESEVLNYTDSSACRLAWTLRPALNSKNETSGCSSHISRYEVESEKTVAAKIIIRAKKLLK